MGVNLGNFSDDDRDRVRDMGSDNKVDISDSDFGFDDDSFFDSLTGDDFGTQSNGNSGSSGSGIFDTLGDPNGQMNNGLDQFGFPIQTVQTVQAGQVGQIGQGFNGVTNNGVPQQQQKGPDMFDKAVSFSGDAAVASGRILKELVASTKNRNADDIGYYSTNLIKVGLGILAGSIVLCIVAALTGLTRFGIGGLGKTMLLSSTLTAGFGMIGIGLAALFIKGTESSSTASLDSISDISAEVENDATGDYEDNLDSVLDELFGSDSDFNGNDVVSVDVENMGFDTQNNKEDEFLPELPDVNFDNVLDNIQSNSLMNREALVNQMSSFLKKNTIDFSNTDEIDESSTKFESLNIQCLKAMARAANCEMEELHSALVEAKETLFSFELKAKRPKKKLNLAAFKEELESYFRDNPNDMSVNASVKVTGDFISIVITKGNTSIITLGDAFTKHEVKEYFLDEKHKLPVIIGVDTQGHVLTGDAKDYHATLVTGQQRSGKSWFVFSTLMYLMMFNPPSMLQFIIIDPKESPMFYTLSLMPHVAGLHNTETGLKAIKDILDNESPKRQKLLKEHMCENIWDLRKSGVEIPLLYLVIDEFITFNDAWKDDIKPLLQVIITKLPSQGIFPIIISHRATGVLDKTIRQNFKYKASIMGNKEQVEETLDIKWDQHLTHPGDMAVVNTDVPGGMFLRAVSMTTSDAENLEFIQAVAKAFYKIGVEQVKLPNIKFAANRNENEVRRRLALGNVVQYDANNDYYSSDDDLINRQESVEMREQNRAVEVDNHGYVDLDDIDYMQFSQDDV